MNKLQIFCDFDGTITKEDTLNKFLRVYADKKWLELEEEWISGKIGSRECTSRQMELIPQLTNEEISNFIDSIEIDEHFKAFMEFVKAENIDFCIVSDGFDYFINRILEKNGLNDIKVFSNHLEIKNGKFLCTFPYSNPECRTGAGMCKCNIIKNRKNVTKAVYYVGDGVSDFCASKKADKIFAKGRLLEYCKKNKIAENGLIGFSSFKEIPEFLKYYKGDSNARN